MNRRIRSPIKATTKREERLHKYLKPGALAQLRDSRMQSRISKRQLQIPISSLRISSSSSSSSSPTGNDLMAQIIAIDGLPCFATRIFGPRFPQRKKLLAVKSVFIVGTSETADLILDSFNTDLVVAH